MADRLSSYQISTASLNNILRAQAQVAKTSEQVSSGRRVATPADDPVANSRILQLNQELALGAQYVKNIDSLQGRLEYQESIMVGMEVVMQRVRELAVAAGNGTTTQTDRQAYAAEIKLRMDELFQQINSKDASGEFLFSGFSGQTQAFVKNPGGGYTYQGDEGQRLVRISNSNSVPVSDNGKDIFLDVPIKKPSFYTYGNELNRGNPPGVISQGVIFNEEEFQDFYPNDAIITFNNELDVEPPGANFTIRRRSDNSVVEGQKNVAFVPGQQVQFGGMLISISGKPVAGDNFVVETTTKQGPLYTLEKLVDGLMMLGDSFDESQAVSNLVGDSLDNIDSAIENISIYRAKIGARLNTAETTKDIHLDLELVSKDVRSKLADVDLAEAVSRLQMETTALQAAQQTYVKVSSLSLFNFIR
ncbi:flagellar hook-associated protein FlgL [Salinispirillum sp. LH 10-3-1]|uniref:Flagellar hook-associated protein FlgL n=1 Tax=Salinispirillum sp. LH 10-3-1 TaxID=2952525 RepID=A0AB38YCH8_9GAMM